MISYNGEEYVKYSSSIEALEELGKEKDKEIEKLREENDIAKEKVKSAIKEIEKLNNIINKLENLIESAYNWEGVDFQVKVNGKWTITEDMEEVRKYIQELKGEDKE